MEEFLKATGFQIKSSARAGSSPQLVKYFSAHGTTASEKAKGYTNTQMEQSSKACLRRIKSTVRAKSSIVMGNYASKVSTRAI